MFATVLYALVENLEGDVVLLCVADRQVQIVELEGLKLLLPLTQSKDTEVQRLAAHALANLSVNCESSLRYVRFHSVLPFWI